MKFVCAAIILLITLSAGAQRMNFSRFSYAEGLNTYNIKKTVQDRYGFIWVATQDGLYRFDGGRFEAFRKSGTAAVGLRENFIFDMSYPGGDELYLASFRGGIDRINVRTLEVTHCLPDPKRIDVDTHDLWISKLTCDRFGNLWIGGKDYLAVSRAGKQGLVSLSDVVKSGSSEQMTFIKPVDSGIMAVGIADKGVLLYDMATLKLVALLDSLGPGIRVPEYQISDLLVHDGAVFIATNTTLVKGRIHNRRWIFERHIPLPGLSGAVITCMAADESGTIWLGTNSGLGSYKTGTGTFALLQSDLYRKRWLEDNTINHLMIDRHNNLWIATLKALQAVNLNPSSFTPYTGDHPGSDGMDHLYALIARYGRAV